MAPGEDDTRERILKKSAELFAAQGALTTSVREIAEHLNISKAAVLYHFETKAHIIGELAGPLVAAMAAALDRCEREHAPPIEVARALLDAYLEHRSVLSLVLSNLETAAQAEGFQRWMRLGFRAQELIAGPDAGVREKVFAIQLTALVSDAVAILTSVPVDQLRREIMAGVTRYAETQPRRRGVGRPSRIDAALLRRALALHKDMSIDEVAKTVGVSRATLYRHLSRNKQ